MVILMTSLSSSKTEFACIFYDVFDVGGFAVLMLLVVLFPTSLSLLNSDLICRSYGSFGFPASIYLFAWAYLRHISGSTALSRGSTVPVELPLFLYRLKYRLFYVFCTALPFGRK